MSGPSVREFVVKLPERFPCETVRLTLSLPVLPADGGHTRFGEHVLDASRRATGDRVLATGLGCFHRSDDLGERWRRVGLPGFANVPFVNSFTLPDGRTVIQSATGDLILCCDEHGEVESAFRPAEAGFDWGAPWHGTSSVDYAGGVLMYAEYPNNPGTRDGPPRTPSRVFRSTDASRSWQCMFEVDGQTVRHFHSLRADPDRDHTWWLASGDLPDECRIWRSSDDGESWEDLTADLDTLVEVGDRTYPHTIFRLTDFAFPDPDTMLWGTDDVLGVVDPALPMVRRGGSRVFSAARTGSFAVREVGYCGQAIRSIVDCGPCYLLITQCVPLEHTKRAAVHILFKNLELGCHPLIEVENFGSPITPFTASRSSRFARDGTFFSFRTATDVFTDPLRVLRWDLELA